MEQIKFTDEILKNQLMYHMGYSASESEIIVERYRRNCELDDLAAVVQEKERANSRL